MAILAKREHRTYIIICKEKSTTPVHKSPQGVQTSIKIKPMTKLMGIHNNARREIQNPLNV